MKNIFRIQIAFGSPFNKFLDKQEKKIFDENHESVPKLELESSRRNLGRIRTGIGKRLPVRPFQFVWTVFQQTNYSSLGSCRRLENPQTGASYCVTSRPSGTCCVQGWWTAAIHLVLDVFCSGEHQKNTRDWLMTGLLESKPGMLPRNLWKQTTKEKKISFAN